MKITKKQLKEIIKRTIQEQVGEKDLEELSHKVKEAGEMLRQASVQADLTGEDELGDELYKAWIAATDVELLIKRMQK